MSTPARPTDLSPEAFLAFIETSGGWRHFMRFASEVPENITNTLDHARVARFPRAVLGVVFAQAKMGDISGARVELDRWNSVLLARADVDQEFAADLTLVDTHVAVYEDRGFGPEVIARLHHARTNVAKDDLVGQALAANHLCTVALHMGDFDKAQDHAEQAVRLFRLGGAAFGALHLNTHLGQIRLMRGDLAGAENVFEAMEAELADLPGHPEWLIAAGRILRAEVAYEVNDLDRANMMMRLAFDEEPHKDAWFDILTAAFRVRTRLAYTEAGLPGALEALSHAEQIAQARDMPRLHRLMQIERVRALTLSDETDAAARVLRDIGLAADKVMPEDSDDWAYRQGSTFVALARLKVRSRRASEALEFIGPAEDFAIRGGQLLSLAKLRVIAASAHWRLGARTEATSSLLSAIRLLGQQPFRRFILDEGPEMHFIVQAALDGDHIAVPPTREQRRRLSELTHYWATSGRGTANHNKAETAELHHRYLELLSVGHSNKEIARVMGVTLNTVKYHLKQIFRELDADNRSRAVQRARDLGLLER